MSKRMKKEAERKRQIKMHGRSKQCGKKKAYDTQDEADGYAKMYSDPRYGIKGQSTELHSYCCPQCHKWHLTKQPQKKVALHA